jgi:threonine 3-dehydrogenase
MDLSAVITHEMPLSEFRTAFALVRNGQSGKVVMYPNGLPDAA